MNSRCDTGVSARAMACRFLQGRAVTGHQARGAPGWLTPVASAISPGTELRHLAATVVGPPRDAGYMAIAADRGDLVLAAAPHGAFIAEDHPQLLRVPASTGINRLTVARFMLIASLGIDLLPDGALSGEVLLIGSGPVAMACALELRRRGADNIRVLTSRRSAPISTIPDIEVSARADLAWCVIDAAGRLETALSAVSDAGNVGLLATPDPAASVSALAVHRRGLSAVGMHELVGYDHQIYAGRLGAIADWLTCALPEPLIDFWCLHTPGSHAGRLFGQLAGSRRPERPFLILDWSP